VLKVRQFKKVQVCNVSSLHNKELTAVGFEVAFQQWSNILYYPILKNCSSNF
jgi:hypothetical protein